MTETPDKRKLSELRVVDLKQELEKRGKDGNGVKNVLLERLTQALREEGHDPETMEFEIVVGGKASVKKGKANAGGKTDEESSNTDASVTVDQTVDASETTTSSATEADKASEDEVVIISETKNDDEDEQDTKAAPVQLEDGDEKESDAGENAAEQKQNSKQEKDDFVKPAVCVPQEKVVPKPEQTKPVEMKEDSKEADNEDSLNLTIGEEDEKLLHDSNMDTDQKEVETPKKEQPVTPKTKESASEESKKNDEKREGKIEKNVIASSNSEKGSRRQRGR